MPAANAISNQREQEILREVRLSGGSCRISYLAKTLGVSDETIRRNIKTLQASGLVKKVHGGVSLVGLVSVVETPFQHRMDKSTAAKKALAAQVADLVENGASLFLDVGSTMTYVAQALQNHRDLYVVTNSITVAHTLTARNNNRIFMAGGELRALDGGVFGSDAVCFVERFNVKYAITSVAAINANAGFMLYDMQEADITCAALKRAQTCFVLADSSKFEKRAPVTIQKPQDIDMLITNAEPAPQTRSMLERHEIAVTVASA